MSRQSEAKEKQGYRTTPRSCGSCRHFLSDAVPIKWMVEANAEAEQAGVKPRYDFRLSANNVERNLRCGLGNFAVKKMASCKYWEDAEE